MVSGGLRSLGSFAQGELGRTGVVGVERWAEVRRLGFVRGLSIGETTGGPGCTARRSALRWPAMSRRGIRGRRRALSSIRLRDEVHRLLRADPKLPGQRIRELVGPLGFDGGKDDRR